MINKAQVHFNSDKLWPQREKQFLGLVYGDYKYVQDVLQPLGEVREGATRSSPHTPLFEALTCLGQPTSAF